MTGARIGNAIGTLGGLPGSHRGWRTDTGRTCQPVWRKSYDVEDPRANVHRPIGDGTLAGALFFADCYVKTMEAWADQFKVDGRAHELTANAIRVARVLLTRLTDFATGRCQPCIETIMAKTRFARPTVIALLKKLRSAGFLDWVRRTVRIEDAQPGEQRVAQTSNSYFFDVASLPKRAKAYLKQLLDRKPAFRSESDFTAPARVGSGPVPNAKQRMVEKVVRSCSGGSQRRADADRRRLAASMKDASPAEAAALLYPDDAEAQAFHLEHVASSQSAPQSPRSKRE